MLALLACVIPLRATPPAAADSDYFGAIRTPPTPSTPHINGPRVYGARPGHPFLYHLPVSGQRPITITARDLPAGLTLDPATGDIAGAVATPGEYAVEFTARNGIGWDKAGLRIVIGPAICLTPPLGWNSWNCFGPEIDAKKIMAAANAMAGSGLIDHGWTYINLDDGWEGERDAAGKIQPHAKMLDMTVLADYVHGKGLKIGIYSSPGSLTCAGYAGSYLHENQDAATYAAWGMDYLKYDWCSYQHIQAPIRAIQWASLLTLEKAGEAKTLVMESVMLDLFRNRRDPADLAQSAAYREVAIKFAAFYPEQTIASIAAKYTGSSGEQILARIKVVRSRIGELRAEAQKADPARFAAIEDEILKEPFRLMGASLAQVNRDIVYSFNSWAKEGAADPVWKWGPGVGGNLWRTTGDMSPKWKSIEAGGFGQNGLEKWAGPGHWNDPDMLQIGNGQLTPDENYTHMTLWCMLSAPLLIGCDMQKMSPFVASLFRNDEVLAVDQDALGRQGWRARQDGQKEVWMKPLADGAMAVAFFNRGETPAAVAIQWSELKLTGPQTVRDLWRQKDLGVQTEGYTVNVAPRGAEFFRMESIK